MTLWTADFDANPELIADDQYSPDIRTGDVFNLHPVGNNIGVIEWYADVVIHATLTVYARTSWGTVDSSSYIKIDAVSGGLIIFNVAQAGSIIASHTVDWDTVVEATGAPTGFAVHYENTGIGRAGISFELFNDTNQWFEWWFTPTLWDPADSVMPHLGPGATGSHKLTVASYEAEEPTPNPDTTIHDPIQVKDFLMTPEMWSGQNPNDPDFPEYYYFRMTGTIAHFEYQHLGPNWYTNQPFSIPQYQGMMWEVTFPYDGPGFAIGLSNNVNGSDISIGMNTSYTEPRVTNTSGMEYVTHDVTIDFIPRFFRIWRNGEDRLITEVSPDGTTWNPVMSGSTMIDPNTNDYNLVMELGGFVDIHQMRGFALPAPLTDTPAPHVHDPYDGTKPVKPTTAKTCITVLQAIKDYSLAVGASVRITSPTTIELVDPNEPLPTGWSTTDADDLYIQDDQTLQGFVGTHVVAFTASAIMQTGDVRLLLSDWRIPQRLPVDGLDPAVVQKVSYTISPLGFTENVEFYIPPQLPISITRTDD